MNRWKPIKTAPKDGTSILLWFPGPKNNVQIGHWWEEQTIRGGKVIRSYAEWLWGGYFPDLLGRKRPEPTHWMPMLRGPK